MQFIKFYFHPALNALISNSGVMYADFEQSRISPTYSFPWSPQVRLNFTISGAPLRIRKGNDGALITLPDCSLIGPQLCTNTIHFDPSSVMACLCFHHGSFHRLTGIPIHELVDQDLDAALLLGKGIKQVSLALKTARDPEHMKNIIEDFFLKRIQLRSGIMQPFDSAIMQWTGSYGNRSVTETARNACLSTRQFERICNERLGVTPKLFARLIRFSKAHALAEQRPDLTWTHLAYRCGYYDQMHLIRDFKKFAGITPQIITGKADHSLKLIHLLETDHDKLHYQLYNQEELSPGEHLYKL